MPTIGTIMRLDPFSVEVEVPLLCRCPDSSPESTIMSRSAQWLVSYPNSKIDSLSLEFFPKSLLARITAKVNTAVIIGTFMDQYSVVEDFADQE